MVLFLSLFLAYMILFYMNPSPNPNGILETTFNQQTHQKYYDLVTPGKFSLYALVIDSFLLLFIFYNIMNVFRLNRYPHVMMTTLERVRSISHTLGCLTSCSVPSPISPYTARLLLHRVEVVGVLDP